MFVSIQHALRLLIVAIFVGISAFTGQFDEFYIIIAAQLPFVANHVKLNSLILKFSCLMSNSRELMHIFGIETWR